ncbi:MAG: sugar ABC transporter permease [Spirochaetia bacterium]|nr:sugar ABC transporter permease [Spirochaetia bacterium]
MAIRSAISKRFTPFLLILPSLMIILGLFLFPFIYNVFLSLNDWSQGGGRHVFAGLQNYNRLFRDENFINSIRISLKFTVYSVLIEFLLGLGIALLLDGVTRGKKLLRVLIVIPMAITPIVSSLTWKTLIYSTSFGVLNYLLSVLGLSGQAWLADSNLALGSLIAMEVWHWTPFMVIIFVAGLSSLPEECYEAAYVDGAKPVQIFFRITLPLLIPVTFVGIIFRTIDAFRTFDVIFALTAGGPGTVTQAMPLYIFQTTFEYYRIGEGSAAAFVIVVIAMVIVTCLYSLSRILKRDAQ